MDSVLFEMRRNPYTISFIVLNYNDAETTITMVERLCQWKDPSLKLNVVIVDNRSTDESLSRLKARFANSALVEVICSEKNGGYSYGNNYGAKYAIEHFKPDYIAIANPDIVVEEQAVIELLGTFHVNNRVAMCSPVMKSINGSFRIYSQSLPTWWDDLKACRLGNHSDTLHENNYQTLDEDGNLIITEMLPGSFFVIRSDVFEEIGMLDENVFLYCEERILGKKLKDAGYKVILRKELFFVHAHAISTSKAFSVLKREQLMLSSRLYYQKEYGKCNTAQLFCLKTAMRVFLLELKMLLLYTHLVSKM